MEINNSINYDLTFSMLSKMSPSAELTSSTVPTKSIYEWLWRLDSESAKIPIVAFEALWTSLIPSKSFPMNLTSWEVTYIEKLRAGYKLIIYVYQQENN